MKSVFLPQEHFSLSQKFVEVKINGKITEVLIGKEVEVADNVALILMDTYPQVRVIEETEAKVEKAEKKKEKKATKTSKAKKKN